MIASKGMLWGVLLVLCVLTLLLGAGWFIRLLRAGGWETVMVPMRDGVRLHTRILVPGDGAHPVVLMRGYLPAEYNALRFVEAGYVFVGQSTRGHGQSEGAGGVRDRFRHDGADGYDTLDWIARQPWCDGNVAMYGKSYWAITQWLVAPLGHPALKAIVPQNASSEWKVGYYVNGALSLAMTARGRAFDRNDRPTIEAMGWRDYFLHLPLVTLDEITDGGSAAGSGQLWKDYVRHSTYDEYWQAVAAPTEYERIRIPVYLMGGWYDLYPGAALDAFSRLRAVGATEEVRVVIDPTDHLNRVVGDRDFGDRVPKDDIGLAIRWLDHVVRGVDNGIGEEPPVRLFTMGVNEWRSASDWPIPGTEFTKFYFRSPDGSRRGGLSTEPPGDEPPTVYVYDPADPVPTLGGNHSFTDTDLPDVIRGGPVDQRPNESRPDVLVFTTGPLAEDTEVTGPVVVRLFAASSARDTDFTAKLIDVHPDGRAMNLTEGIVRARFRESVWEPPKPLVPGEVCEYEIPLLPTSNVFRAGHRIRVHLTSSNFPLHARNLNTGSDPATDVEIVRAEQTVHHDRDRPSHLVLPVIRR